MTVVLPSPKPHAVRLHVLLARQRRVGVVLRRGPSKAVQLVRWDLSRDTFEPGQWLRGRVYEHRCDLSPRGDLLAYFAAKNKGPYPAYTAISRPPYFTALALWPTLGTYGGGGLFASDSCFELNHRGSQSALAEGFSLPKRLRVSPLADHAGLGEDDPILHYRRLRDGWRLAEGGEVVKESFDAPIWIVYDPPQVYAKARPRTPHLELEHRLRGIKQKNGPWYVVDHAVVNRTDGSETLFEGCGWADWDSNGDLLFARDGQLFRAPVVRSVLQAPKALIDLGEQTFRRVIAPPEARRW
ncbi:MAG: hypothetical protein KC619_14230 [Myxococcales bacterium]|nr:hypothetical protein [Myxococcales bacterium]